MAAALYLRAGKTPAGLINGTTEDTTDNVTVPSVLLTPEWVTTANMNSTVVKDKFVPVRSSAAAPTPPTARLPVSPRSVPPWSYRYW